MSVPIMLLKIIFSRLTPIKLVPNLAVPAAPNQAVPFRAVPCHASPCLPSQTEPIRIKPRPAPRRRACPVQIVICLAKSAFETSFGLPGRNMYLERTVFLDSPVNFAISTTLSIFRSGKASFRSARLSLNPSLSRLITASSPLPTLPKEAR